jgi:hypothetical protein
VGAISLSSDTVGEKAIHTHSHSSPTYEAETNVAPSQTAVADPNMLEAAKKIDKVAPPPTRRNTFAP